MEAYANLSSSPSAYIDALQWQAVAEVLDMTVHYLGITEKEYTILEDMAQGKKQASPIHTNGGETVDLYGLTQALRFVPSSHADAQGERNRPIGEVLQGRTVYEWLQSVPREQCVIIHTIAPAPGGDDRNDGAERRPGGGHCCPALHIDLNHPLATPIGGHADRVLFPEARGYDVVGEMWLRLGDQTLAAGHPMAATEDPRAARQHYTEAMAVDAADNPQTPSQQTRGGKRQAAERSSDSPPEEHPSSVPR
jgi:hypothetical protein